MQNETYSRATEFILQGFSDYGIIQTVLFFLFFIVYLLTLMGNILIISAVYLNPLLHNPMYFLLCNLSILDISYSTVIQPKLLSTLWTRNGTILFEGCITQLYFFMCLTCTEFVLLTAMGYDRYVAICDPLHYALLINTRTCTKLALACWVVGFLDPLAHTVAIAQLPFCKSRVIRHFYCDYSVLVKLSCADTFLIETMSILFGSLVGFSTFSLTLTSYVNIISTVLKISSAVGRKKTFSTCVSHLTVVILFYGTVLITYMRPTSQYSSSEGKTFSVFYTVLIPMSNPIIYTLRNKEVINHLSKLNGIKSLVNIIKRC